ncbi:helix-turn-helix domain-containing protein [Humisphaera borealis]|uniref:Helix-turn-helix transcriptional regulator n=1 Tax=Humisphaera borealis TaxID=2807512 RepID=A0A7M2WZY1_9BACT|nr:helix-turn-helix transcriptional regulator [Humisphaera borealis]QOV90963.1 helix-turn-helix transcriptional regulator [Humisphaera borealis]
MEPLAKVFGGRLRALRKASGMTQEELGRAAAIDYKHISGLERGANVPSFEAIERLAKALKVDYYELFLPARIDVGREEQVVRVLVRELERQASPGTLRFVATVLGAIRTHEADRKGAAIS